jgi:hypothetical protein
LWVIRRSGKATTASSSTLSNFIQSGLISRSSDLPYLSLLASALSISISDTLVDIVSHKISHSKVQGKARCTQVYKSHHPSYESFEAINLLIFAVGCLAHLSLYIFGVTFLGTRSHSFGSHADPIALALSCLSEAGRDLSALYVIYCEYFDFHACLVLRPADYNVILESIMTSLASTVVLLLLTAGFLNEPGVFVGCLLALIAAGVYVSGIRQTTEEDVGSECVTRVG